jgi:hypothetical protein
MEQKIQTYIHAAIVYWVLTKSSQNIPWRKDSLLNKYCWENWISTCQSPKLDPYLFTLYWYQLK